MKAIWMASRGWLVLLCVCYTLAGIVAAALDAWVLEPEPPEPRLSEIVTEDGEMLPVVWDVAEEPKNPEPVVLVCDCKAAADKAVTEAQDLVSDRMAAIAKAYLLCIDATRAHGIEVPRQLSEIEAMERSRICGKCPEVKP